MMVSISRVIKWLRFIPDGCVTDHRLPRCGHCAAGDTDTEDREFEYYEDEADAWRWRLVHRNGTILARSARDFDTAADAEAAVDRVRTRAVQADVLDIGPAAFELFEDEGGQYRWRLRHRNGNILADSGQGYADRRGAQQGIDSVKRNAVGAPSDDVTDADD